MPMLELTTDKDVGLVLGVVAALTLVLIEAVGGIPAVGLALTALLCAVSIVAALVQLFRDRAQARTSLIKATVYAAAFAMIAGAYRGNGWIAKHNAGQVIAAVERYHDANGRYPLALDQLVPRFIDDIPLSSLRLTGNRFELVDGERGPTLYWTVLPPDGREGYRFADRRWLGVGDTGGDG